MARWSGKLDELLLVNNEVDRELASLVHRESSMQSRATILVGAASVVGAIQIGDNISPFTIATLLLSLAAAILGVLVVFPRTGDAPDPQRMHEAVLNGTDADEAVHRMIEIKLKTLREDEDSLKSRGKLARAGLVLLSLSILASVIGGIANVASTDGGASTPTPTVTHE